MTAVSVLPDGMRGQVAWIVREIAEMKRRERNRSRDGKVIEANPEAGLYKVRLRPADGDTPAYDTGWLRVQAISTGTVKIQGEPVIGQPVRVVTESGDMTDAEIALSSFNEDNARPHDLNGELKISVSDGAYSQLLKADGSETSMATSRAITTTGAEVTQAASRVHTTDGNLIFNTGGIVEFN